MSATVELFEKWKAAKHVGSDREGLRILGLSPGASTHWRNGKEAAADIIERMAKDSGEDPAKWAALAMAGQTKGETARAWTRIARRLGAAAALAFVALLPIGNAQANSLIPQGDFASNAYYVKLRGWVRRVLASMTPMPA